MESAVRTIKRVFLSLLAFGMTAGLARAGEADLKLPDLSSVSFTGAGGMNGRNILLMGILVCAFGLLFGAVQFVQLRKMKVHRSMKDISDLIYETCKTYLITQGKFIMVLWALVAIIMGVYFGYLRHFSLAKVTLILVCSLIGIAGSYAVAWFGMRVNTFANSRSAFASLGGKPYPTYAIPLKAGMSIGMLLISIELLVMLCILLFVDVASAGACFIGFAIGESLGASVLRIAGGIFTKIADVGSDLMKIVFNIKEDDARNPGVIADCAGDNAGDSVGPTADGFETYGVTGVALISFILLAILPDAAPAVPARSAASDPPAPSPPLSETPEPAVAGRHRPAPPACPAAVPAAPRLGQKCHSAAAAPRAAAGCGGASARCCSNPPGT